MRVSTIISQIEDHININSDDENDCEMLEVLMNSKLNLKINGNGGTDNNFKPN